MKPRFKLSVGAIIVASAVALSACKSTPEQHTKLTEADAVAFLDSAAEQLVDLNFRSSRAAWIYANFITHDTASLAADVNEEYTAALVELANQAAQFDGMQLTADTRRKLDKLKLNLTLPAPKDADKTAERCTGR